MVLARLDEQEVMSPPVHAHGESKATAAFGDGEAIYRVQWILILYCFAFFSFTEAQFSSVQF